MGREQDFETPPEGGRGSAPPLFDERSARAAHQVVPLAAVGSGWRARFGAWRGSLAGLAARPWLLLMALLVAALVGATTYGYLSHRGAHGAPPAAASGETPARTNTQAVNRNEGDRTEATRGAESAQTADDTRAPAGDEPPAATDRAATPAAAGVERAPRHARTRRAFRPRAGGGARLVSVIH
ncbi:MAG: hypothetical protein LC746_01290 [Acidobacteria bacterium]|nr:hypothetical protein [Acidobacteriota bacterium]